MEKIIAEYYHADKTIPITTFCKEGKSNLPVVFFVHGFESNRIQSEGFHQIAYQLAQKDFFAITLDAYLHGERAPEDPDFKRKDAFFHIIVQTVKDIECLIQTFKEDARCNPDKIGITGTSMGGLTSFYALATIPEIQAAAPALATPYFERFLNEQIEPNERDSEQFKEIYSFIKQHDPSRHIKNFAPRPLLMLNGRKDLTIPYAHIDDFYQQIQPYYQSCPENLALKSYDLDHTLSDEICHEIQNWFCRFLKNR